MIASAWPVRVLTERVQEAIFRQVGSHQHAFGNHDTAETVGKINRRLAYRGVGDVDRTVQTKRAILVR